MNKFLMPAIGAVLAITVGNANATVIDFENLPSGSCVGLGSGVTSGGFSFVGVGGTASFYQCNPGVLQNNTSRALLDNQSTSSWGMFLTGGGVFDLNSFDGGTATQDFNSSVPGSRNSSGVSITGFISGGGTVTQDFFWDGVNFDNFLLPSTFSNLTQANFVALDNDGGRAQFMVDNIVVNEQFSSSSPVPAPGALALLGFGLIGLGLRRRTA